MLSLLLTNTIQELYDMETLKTQLVFALEDLILDGQRLVIFIDELDRCNPVFAVKMLERIKHFFNSPKILFVFSVNIEQLSATIKKTYGSEFDSSGYLNKFFDIIVDIPPVSIDKFINLSAYQTSRYIDSFINSLFESVPSSVEIAVS